MSVFHQMGHQSDNLLADPNLVGYAGAILSPVNYDQQSVGGIVSIYRERADFETIFDPQLYYPKTERQKLRNWRYSPQDVDTIDISSFNWWERLVTELTVTIDEIRPNSVCSPVIAPRSYTDDYFSLMTQVTDCLYDSISPLSISVLHTVLVGLTELADYRRVQSIASIITRTKASRFYIIFMGNVNPRLELGDPEELKGAMLLINILEENGLDVLVGYCSSDVVLWKEAGATSCASGKFFNLRRFTPSRWDESDGGGGQMAYWFEEALLAYIRESDVQRVQRAGILSSSNRLNPFSNEILSCISTGTPWVGLGWRQFLYWFFDAEARFNSKIINAFELLQAADRNWLTVEQRPVILEERRNNGSWIRQWQRAVTEFQEPW